MTFLGPYDGKQSLYGEILDVFCKKSEHWLPTGVIDPDNFRFHDAGQ